MPAAPIVPGGTMRYTTAALLAAAVLALAGCSNSSSEHKPTPTVTVAKTPKLSAVEQRKACVDAWAKLLHKNADADQNADEPGACTDLSGDHYGMYWDGMMQRNRENREEARKCLDNPTCTALPVEP